MGSDLTKRFGVSTQTPSGVSLDELRQSYYIEANMRGNDAASIGGLQVNTSGRKDAAMLAQRKAQQATNDFILLADLQRQLATIENAMVDKYGEDFAEQFAAEYLEEDVFNEIMQIEDPEKRRQAFAQAINDGIRNGTIDADDVNANPDFAGWLDRHDQIRAEISRAPVEIAVNSERTVDALSDTSLSSDLGDFLTNNPV